MAIDLTDDLQVMAATIWGEARGEGLVGQQAVAIVVMNRVACAAGRRQFGDGTVRGACLRPYQFSCWLHSDPNLPKMLALDPMKADAVFAQCLAVARQAIAGKLVDPTGGRLTDPARPADHYKTNLLPWPPAWGAPTPPLAVIGNQSFYHLV